jgi:RNA recognition motif-containing protein
LQSFTLPFVIFYPSLLVVTAIITKSIVLFNKSFFMNMYVSNLSFNTNDEALKQLFEKFGTVSSAKVITDRETGRSRGFGFVEMANDTEANAAMSGLNNTEVEGRAMSVSVAREKQPRNDSRRW